MNFFIRTIGVFFAFFFLMIWAFRLLPSPSGFPLYVGSAALRLVPAAIPNAGRNLL